MTSRTAALLVSTFAFVAATGCRGKSQDKPALPPATGPSAPPMPKLPTIAAAPPPAQAHPTSDTRATGTLYPRAEAQLAPNASGVIAEVLVKEGDRVKRGDVVFRLDTGDLSLRRQQAAAALEAARVNQRAAKVELDRAKPMLEQNAMARAQWDQIQARYDGAAVGVRQAEVALAMAQKGLSDATVRSPFDGVVTAKLKSVGEMATMMPPTVVVVVQDQSVLELRFRLPERWLTKVKAGSPVTARFEALGALSRQATVSRVNPTIDVRTRTVEVVAELQNQDQALRPGLLADVDLGEPPAGAREGGSQ